MPKREQRIALITGANKGIGFEVARQLARKDFHVFLGARNVNAGRAAAEKLRAESGDKKQRNNVEFLEIDVSKPDSVRRAAGEFSKHADHLDVLVNNAGIIVD